MRMIERQLHTAVNNLVKWCDTNGHSISSCKSCCLQFERKRVFIPTPKYAPVSTSPEQGLYVNCNQLPLDIRQRKLYFAYYFRDLVRSFTSSERYEPHHQYEKTIINGRLTFGRLWIGCVCANATAQAQ
ncbi:hypothetical protein TNCV_3766871 [Trichonephila clavipes]|nr:hypothetical protein TNCV_3766871 [Trichonephila clavipes]